MEAFIIKEDSLDGVHITTKEIRGVSIKAVEILGRDQTLFEELSTIRDLVEYRAVIVAIDRVKVQIREFPNKEISNTS